ncbi:MAG: tetratricopeptide repeat protein [Anaerolineaceae bacterium]|nr:tetratricopeptide repeat protein [Anaerolineaceae bacterium]
MRTFAILLVLLLVTLPAAAQPAAPPATSFDQLMTAVQAVTTFSRARLYAQVEDYQHALADYSQVIALAPDGALAYLERGDTQIQLNDLSAALADFNRYIELLPMSPEGYQVRGKLYVRQRNLDAALVDFNQALAVDPAYAPAYLERGLLYRVTGDPDAALTDYDQYTSLQPEDAEGYFRRADLYLALDNLPAVVDDLSQAIIYRPDASVLYLIRGYAETQLEQYPEGATDYYQWIKMNRQNTFDEDVLQNGERIRIRMSFGALFRVPFTVEAGQKINMVAVTADGRSDPLIVILDPNGIPLIANDDVSDSDLSAAILNYQAPVTGQYTAVIGHARGGWDGPVIVALLLENQKQIRLWPPDSLAG